MRLFRPIVLAGAAFGALALILPFATLPVVGTVDGIDGAAWPALLPMIPVALIAAIGDWARNPGPALGMLGLLSACGAVLLAAVKVADVLAATSATEGSSMGPGAFVLLGASIVVAVGATLSLRRA